VHTPPETNYTALVSRSSPVQLLKWQDRWRHYLRSVANMCISFEITYVLIAIVVAVVDIHSQDYWWYCLVLLLLRWWWMYTATTVDGTVYCCY